MFVVTSYYWQQQNHSATKPFGFVIVGNATRNESIIVAGKVIGDFFLFL